MKSLLGLDSEYVNALYDSSGWGVKVEPSQQPGLSDPKYLCDFRVLGLADLPLGPDLVDFSDVEVEFTVEHVDSVDCLAALEVVAGLLSGFPDRALLDGLSLCDFALGEAVLASPAVLYNQISFLLLLWVLIRDDGSAFYYVASVGEAGLDFMVKETQFFREEVVESVDKLELLLFLL